MGTLNFLARDDASDAIAQGPRTVAVLDAACLFGLPERLEAQELEALCLFKGDAAQELRDVAPYLVRIDPEGRLLTDLLDAGDGPTAYWHQRPGIVLRTDMALRDLQKHLRRFLRLSVADKTFFFRFWEAAPLRAYFGSLPDDDVMRQRWFQAYEGGLIDAFWVPDPDQDGFVIAARGEVSDAQPMGFHLRQPEVQAIQMARMGTDLHALTVLLVTTFPERTAEHRPEDLERGVARSVGRGMEFGIRQKNNLFRIAAWDLHGGGQFEKGDPHGQLAEILRSAQPEDDKMVRLKERLAQIEG